MLSAPPTRPSPRMAPHTTRGPVVSTSPVKREPSTTNVGETPSWSISRRFGASLIDSPSRVARTTPEAREIAGRSKRALVGELFHVAAVIAPTLRWPSRSSRAGHGSSRASGHRIAGAPGSRMSMMLTFRAGKLAALMVSVAVLSACSREQQDWRSAEASDTVQGYGEFLQRHPDSELATEARTRVSQLSEDREWQSAGSADTADAYKQFLAQHPNGKWAQEARIRMENFALGREGAAAVPGVSAAVPAEGTAGAGRLAGVGVGGSAGGYGSGVAIGSTAGAASAAAGG